MNKNSTASPVSPGADGSAIITKRFAAKVLKRNIELESENLDLRRMLPDIFLPRITPQISERFPEWIEDGQWTQSAVDFACMLKECRMFLPNADIRHAGPGRVD